MHHLTHSRSLAGLVLLVDAAFNHVPFYPYACTVGSVGLFFGIVGFVVLKCLPQYYMHLEFGSVTAGACVGALLFVWWSVAVGILTFQGPYLALSNGYLAT